MFYVIYEFTVDAAARGEFEKLWHDLTIEIRNNSGGLGSRLHKALNKPNSWVAYAQWPDKETWENAAPLNVSFQASLRKRMREVCSDIKVVYQLEMTDDLLADAPSIASELGAVPHIG